MVKEIKFGAPPRAGVYKFKVHIVSDSYLGLDQEIPFDMKVGEPASSGLIASRLSFSGTLGAQS